MNKIFIIVVSLVFSSLLTSCGAALSLGGSNTSPSLTPPAGPPGVPKVWNHPDDINDHWDVAGQSVMRTKSAIDSNGDAIVVWSQLVAGISQIFKAESRGGVWTKPSALADNISPDGFQAEDAQVAMDDNGNAIIVWSQNGQIYKSEYRLGAWIHPADINDFIATGIQPYVDMDNNGNAIIIWLEWDGFDSQVYKAEYRVGAWTFPAGANDNISPDGESANRARVAMANNGEAVIVWRQYDGANDQIYKSHYRVGAWTNPADLNDNVTPPGTDVDSDVAHAIAMDNSGNIIITWAQDDGVTRQAYKAEYRNNAWTIPANHADNISNAVGSGGPPIVAMSDNGEAIIVYNADDGNGDSQLFRSEYRNDTWTHSTSLNNNLSLDGDDVYPDGVAMDGSGNVILTYVYGNNLYLSQYENGEWTFADNVNDFVNIDNAATVEMSSVSMNHGGEAILIWSQPNGGRRVYVSEYREE